MSDNEFGGGDVPEDEFEGQEDEIDVDENPDDSDADEFIVRKKDGDEDEENDEETDDEENEGKKKKKSDDSDDESDTEELIVVNHETQQVVGRKNLSAYRELKGVERRTIPVLRKFEKAVFIATRVKQINRGAKSKIPTARLKSTDSIKIAEQELAERVIPNKILRVQPLAKTYELLGIDYFTYIDRD